MGKKTKKNVYWETIWFLFFSSNMKLDAKIFEGFLHFTYFVYFWFTGFKFLKNLYINMAHQSMSILLK